MPAKENSGQWTWPAKDISGPGESTHPNRAILHTTLEGTHFSFLSLKTLPCHLSSHHDNGWWGRLAQLLGNGEGRHEEVYSTCTQNTNASLTRKIIQIWYALGYKDGTILSKQTITSRLSQLNLWLQNLNDKNFVRSNKEMLLLRSAPL